MNAVSLAVFLDFLIRGHSFEQSLHSNPNPLLLPHGRGIQSPLADIMESSKGLFLCLPVG